MTEAGEDPGGEVPAPERSRSRSRAAVTWAAFLLPALLVGAVFLAPYIGPELETPFGFDTPKYVWRAELVMAEGFESLPDSTRDPFRENVDRAGFPLLAGALGSTLGIDPFELAFILPALGGILLALSAGAFAAWALREPLWAVPVFAIAVGLSMNVVLTAGGLLDSLMFDALAVAVVLWTLMAAEGQAALGVGIGLVAAAALVHWIFAGLLAGVLGLVALGLLPGSIRRASGLRDLAGSPPFRIGAVLGGGALLGAAGLAFGVAWPAEVPNLSARQFRAKLSRFLPSYRLPVLGPLAALGAVGAAIGGDRRRRTGAAAAAVWALLPLPAFVLLSLDVDAPVHRILAFALGIPLLAAAGVTWLSRLAADRLRVPGRILAGVLCLAAVGATVVVGSTRWEDERAPVRTEQLVEAAWAGRYLEEAGVEGPVIFVVDPAARVPSFAVRMAHRTIRMALPAASIPDAHVYLGDPELAAAGVPTERENRPAYVHSSRRFMEGIRDILEGEPPIIVLSAFNRGRDEPAGTTVAPGVVVFRGPGGPVQLDPPEFPTKPGPVPLVGMALASLVLLAAVGVGWTMTLGRGPLAPRLATAPAVGLAAILVLGAAADAVGIRSGGAGGLVAPVLGAALGWLPAGVRGLSRRRAT